MKLKRLAHVGLALAASAIMVVGAESSAAASGSNVTISKSWGSTTFIPDGDWLYVHDLDADGYAVHGKIQSYVCANAACDGMHWVDLRTGCNDNTSIGDDGTEVRRCNYDISENLTVHACQVRSKDGVLNGDWVCSASTKS
ncbi:hypothetical protein [Actinoplanes regularis]|uniref:hypothetical protein n=1 Tax=Actinoplanes regularis TaxID=52697 RepID=UPI0024A0852D|nr:hypothetical protein [Actinoplanes regularis]GLW33601.1 hypothetical protein Areg01_65390 [Actinoplanes regularis]